MSPFDVIRNAPRVQCISLITHLGTSLSNGFVLIYKFSLVIMNMQMR